MLAGSWFYTLKSVRYLVLRKGGNAVSFVTYTPYGQNRIMDVPLNKVITKIFIKFKLSYKICVINFQTCVGKCSREQT